MSFILHDQVPNCDKETSTRYPWTEMEVGQGFQVFEGCPSYNAVRQCVYSANKRFAKKGLPNRFRAWRDKDTRCIWVKRIL